MALDGDEVYVVTVDDTDNDIDYWHDAGTDTWSAATAAVSSITSDWVSANIYTRSGSKVLALLYTTTANSDLVYNEISLATAAAGMVFAPKSRIFQHMMVR